MKGFHFSKFDPEAQGKSKFDQLLDLLLFAGNIGRFAGVIVEGRLRHLRIEFVEAALKRSNVRKCVHGTSGLDDLRIARPAACGLAAAIGSQGGFA